MAAGDDEVVVARRLMVQRCLYGVDRNPMAVDLAKVSLWLATLAKEHPLTFVDHALRHGDSLVGLTRRQIEAFHWDDGAEPLQQGIETIELRQCVARVAELRRRIQEAEETVSDWDLRDLWDEVRFELNKVRLFGDLATTAFFEASKPRERTVKRDEYAGAVFAGDFKSGRHLWPSTRSASPCATHRDVASSRTWRALRPVEAGGGAIVISRNAKQFAPPLGRRRRVPWRLAGAFRVVAGRATLTTWPCSSNR